MPEQWEDYDNTEMVYVFDDPDVVQVDPDPDGDLDNDRRQQPSEMYMRQRWKPLHRVMGRTSPLQHIGFEDPSPEPEFGSRGTGTEGLDEKMIYGIGIKVSADLRWDDLDQWFLDKAFRGIEGTRIEFRRGIQDPQSIAVMVFFEDARPASEVIPRINWTYIRDNLATEHAHLECHVKESPYDPDEAGSIRTGWILHH